MQQQLGLHFVKTNIIDKDAAKLFSTLFDMRQSADYEDLFEYEKDDVLKLIAPATNLIAHVSAILSAAENDE